MTWTAKNSQLLNYSVVEREPHLPRALRELLKTAESHKLELNRVWLYGSRARGDARENSDFDLAFEILNKTDWSRFVTQIQDDPPSLHQYDLVDIEQCDEALRKAILNEGVLIYESR